MYNFCMDKIKEFGKLLLTNIFLNCEDLLAFKQSHEKVVSSDIFKELPNEELYSRVLSTTKFEKLSQKDKDLFLFKNFNSSNKQILDEQMYEIEMLGFINQIHNRSCQDLGVKPTQISFVNFKNEALANSVYGCFNMTTDEIYLNVEKDLYNQNPAFLVKLINGLTMEHAIYSNILTALANPEALSNDDYFVAISTAVRFYCLRDMEKYDFYDNVKDFIKDHLYSPSVISESIYALVKSREDFQSARIYGGELREFLRGDEENFFESLSDEIVGKSLIATEDLVEVFKHTSLNQQSEGFYGQIFENIVNAYARDFYNNLGVNMEKDETLEEFIDKLDAELFEERGVDMPTDEELKEFLEEKEKLDNFSNLQEDEEDVYEDEEHRDIDADEINEKEQEELNYHVENVLPNEGCVFNIVKIPFSTPADEIAQ